MELTNEEMGMAVGAMFIRENFKKESKDTVSFLSRKKSNLLFTSEQPFFYLDSNY